jgi:formylglycine-generating enzyme required for sulfatase activity
MKQIVYYCIMFSLVVLVSCADNKQAEKQTNRLVECAAGNDMTGFLPTVENNAAKPDTVPQGMVWIPGGTFSMGTAEANESLCEVKGITVDATPIHRVYVDAFLMDEHEVTNA